MLERDWSRTWIAGHLKKHPKDFWLRIPDDAGGIKPFDGVLLCSCAAPSERGRGVPIAIEFKVWREKGHFKWSCVRPHQLRGLLGWTKAGGEAWVLVYFERTKKTLVFYPTEKLLKEALANG